MPTKKRTRAFRLAQERARRDDARKPAGPKVSKKNAYEQNKRNALRASLRDPQAWTY